jgi:hypothetical protein
VELDVEINLRLVTAPGDAMIMIGCSSSLEVFTILLEMLVSSKISANLFWLLYKETMNYCIT